MNLDNIVGNRIRGERKRLGLTQEELAVKINVSGKSVISNYEQGYSKPDLDTIKILAMLFECTSDYLLGLSNQPKPAFTKDKEEDEFDFVLAANNEGEYGREPSPELRAIIKEILKEEFDKLKKK